MVEVWEDDDEELVEELLAELFWVMRESSETGWALGLKAKVIDGASGSRGVEASVSACLLNELECPNEGDEVDVNRLDGLAGELRERSFKLRDDLEFLDSERSPAPRKAEGADLGEAFEDFA
jgi:hypothetical protein